MKKFKWYDGTNSVHVCSAFIQHYSLEIISIVGRNEPNWFTVNFNTVKTEVPCEDT